MKLFHFRERKKSMHIAPAEADSGGQFHAGAGAGGGEGGFCQFGTVVVFA